VVAPNGGEAWPIASVQAIQWNSSLISGNVKIELSRNGGATFAETLFSNTPNDGIETWTVTGPASSTIRVRVTSVDNPPLSDMSNANFSIEQPSVSVVSPNGGESWITGSTESILWNSSFVAGSVNVELSRDGGTGYEMLFANTSNDGSEAWSVTGLGTVNALVRISSVSDPLVSDVSNGPFTINSVSFALKTKLILWDNGGETDSLEFGTGSGATDGIDAMFGEYEQPPVPPTGVFDARWKIAGTEGTKRDIRDTLGGARQQVIYTGRLQPGTGGYPFRLRWNRFGFPAGTFTLLDQYGGSSFLVNMKQRDSLVITNEELQQFQIVYDAGDVVYLSVQNGWNIISLPLTVPDPRKTTVFPTSTSNAFAFTPMGYVIKDTLKNGVGYWLKFSSTQLVSVGGELRTPDTMDVVQGWNIIGSINSAVQVGDIIQIPGGVVVSPYFGYGSTGYSATSIIEPMNGYWVKASQHGRLVLSGPSLSK